MKFTKASPAERFALVRMVSASAKLIVIIGRAIMNKDVDLSTEGSTDKSGISSASSEFVNAIIGVQESEEEAARESFR